MPETHDPISGQLVLPSITDGSLTILMATPKQAALAGASLMAICAAATLFAAAQISAHASTLRAQLASTDAGKIAEYQIKEAIAANPSKASNAENALLEAEATARGLSLPSLLELIGQRAARLRVAALTVAAWEAQSRAEILDALSGASIDTIEELTFAAIASQKAKIHALLSA